MGRLPSTFEGRQILQRIPYTLAGEFTMTTLLQNQQYPDATFQNNVNKPFEIHRMIPRIYAFSDGAMVVTQPDQELLLGLIRARISDLGLDQLITKSATILGTLLKGSSERTWEWAEPHYLPNNAQLQVVLDALAFPTFNPVATQLRVCITFEGFLLVLGTPVA